MAKITELELMFAIYNRRYFGRRLPKCKVQYADIDHFGDYTLYTISKRSKGGRLETEDRHVIRIAKWSRKTKPQAFLTLLHEMCHLKTRVFDNSSGHGPKFQREMKRLAKIGAFNQLW